MGEGRAPKAGSLEGMQEQLPSAAVDAPVEAYRSSCSALRCVVVPVNRDYINQHGLVAHDCYECVLKLADMTIRAEI